MAIKAREFGSNTFRLLRPFVVSTSAPYAPPQLYGGIPFSEKADFCFRATSISNANGIITVSYGLRLTKN